MMTYRHNSILLISGSISLSQKQPHGHGWAGCGRTRQHRMGDRRLDRSKMAPIFRKDVNDTLEMDPLINCRHDQLVTEHIPSVRHGRSLGSLHQNLTGRLAM